MVHLLHRLYGVDAPVHNIATPAEEDRATSTHRNLFEQYFKHSVFEIRLQTNRPTDTLIAVLRNRTGGEEDGSVHRLSIS